MRQVVSARREKVELEAIGGNCGNRRVVSLHRPYAAGAPWYWRAPLADRQDSGTAFAAGNPLARSKEKEILKEELKNQGKKDDMIDKILVGKLKKASFIKILSIALRISFAGISLAIFFFDSWADLTFKISSFLP